MTEDSRKWWKNAVFYHIYPRSFADSNGDGIGDLQGIIGKIPYLKELGIDAIWMGPFFKSPQVDNGYDISDYRDIDSQFGSLDDICELISVAHDQGIKVLMDLVFNHTSNRHEWFERSCRKEKGYEDYYIWSQPGPDGTLPNNWKATFGGPAWSWNEERKQYYLHLFAPEQPDLNWKNPAVRKEMSDIANFWLAKGADGFRMDVINFISKDFSKENNYTDGPEVLPWLQEFRNGLTDGDNVILVGETPCITPETACRYLDPANKALDMLLVFDHVSVDAGPGGKWDVKDWKPADLIEIFNKWQQTTASPRWASLYMSNHDQPRFLSRVGAEKFRYECATALAGLFFLQRGTPIIYQGDEIGMINPPIKSFEELKDVESINAYHHMVGENKLSAEQTMVRIRKIARDNSRIPMQWTAEKNGGFTNPETEPWFSLGTDYKLCNAEDQSSDPHSVLSFYKELISLCKTPLFSVGDFKLLHNEEVSVYERQHAGETAVVIVNLNSVPNEINRDFSNKNIILCNYQKNKNTSVNSSRLTMRPFELLVLR